MAALTNSERLALADHLALGADEADRLDEMAAEVREMMDRLNLATNPCGSCGHEHYEDRGDFLRHQMLGAAAKRLETVAEELRDQAHRAVPVLDRG